MSDFNVDPEQNYMRISDNDIVLTGQQILNLLELAPPEVQAMILLDIWPVDKPANQDCGV